jgi:hypothetical protein
MATVKKRIRGQPKTVDLQNTRRNFQDRLGHCLAVEGKHFEQFL